ncbi:conserved hypothetical protein [Xenorhabdus bovienii str. kraussei Quebec]|uniref:Uncharacterized protein n=1 Tax=Xenorhabdus bovienii str. kraussei Quebec TaxID=1398203 RepID=A0A077PNC9_XENBV|nr:conserved hypothetical protein [Xenorhabdus bovienii str. kraussei Quebec]
MLWVISVCTENTFILFVFPFLVTVYLRMYGEHSRLLKHSSHAHGLSPYVRRTL